MKKKVLKILMIIFSLVFLNFLFACEEINKQRKQFTIKTDGNINVFVGDSDNPISKLGIQEDGEKFYVEEGKKVICNIKQTFLDKLEDESLFVKNIYKVENNKEENYNDSELEEYPSKYKYELIITSDFSIRIDFDKKEEFRKLEVIASEKVSNLYKKEGESLDFTYESDDKKYNVKFEKNEDDGKYISKLIPLNAKITFNSLKFYIIDYLMINKDKLARLDEDSYSFILKDDTKITLSDDTFRRHYYKIDIKGDKNLIKIDPKVSKYPSDSDVFIRVSDPNKKIEKITINGKPKKFTEQENIQEIPLRVSNDIIIEIKKEGIKDFPNIKNLERDFYIISNDTQKKEAYFFYKEFNKKLSKLKIEGIKEPLRSINNIFFLKYENLGIISYEIDEKDISYYYDGIRINEVLKDKKTSDTIKFSKDELYFPFSYSKDLININEKENTISFNTSGSVKLKKVIVDGFNSKFTNIEYITKYEIRVSKDINRDNFYKENEKDIKPFIRINDASSFYLPTFYSYYSNYQDKKKVDIIKSDYTLEPGFKITIEDFRSNVIIQSSNYRFKKDTNTIQFDDKDLILNKKLWIKITYYDEIIYQNSYFIENDLYKIEKEEDLKDFFSSSKSMAVILNDIIITSEISLVLDSKKIIYGNYNNITSHWKLENVFNISGSEISFYNTSFTLSINPYTKNKQTLFSLSNGTTSFNNVNFINYDKVLMGNNCNILLENIIIKNNDENNTSNHLFKCSDKLDLLLKGAKVINYKSLDSLFDITNINSENNIILTEITFTDRQILEMDLKIFLEELDNLNPDLKKKYFNTNKDLSIIKATPIIKYNINNFPNIKISEEDILNYNTDYDLKVVDIPYLIFVNNNLLDSYLSKIGSGKTYRNFLSAYCDYLKNIKEDINILNIYKIKDEEVIILIP